MSRNPGNQLLPHPPSNHDAGGRFFVDPHLKDEFREVIPFPGCFQKPFGRKGALTTQDDGKHEKRNVAKVTLD
jgi:hypothetical protein